MIIKIKTSRLILLRSCGVVMKINKWTNLIIHLVELIISPIVFNNSLQLTNTRIVTINYHVDRKIESLISRIYEENQIAVYFENARAYLLTHLV